ncbi:MAG: hypothetical protein ABW140_10745 [Candidatus Sedimenticola sp. 6PFRAG1]
MAKTLRFKRSALLLATLGLAGGSALSLATLGVLHTPQVVDVPVEVVRGGALPAQDQLYILAPRTYHHEGKLELSLESDATVRLITSEDHYNYLKDRQPLTLDGVDPTEHTVVLRDEQGEEIEIVGLNRDDPEHEKVLVLFMAHLTDKNG